jgi:hypothetical protein
MFFCISFFISFNKKEMVSVKWSSRITGNIDSTNAVFDPQVNTTVFGEIAYSQSIVSNSSGEDQTISFKNAAGAEAFTLSFPDGEHNLFWKTDANGTPLWGFVVSSSTVFSTIVDSDGNLYFTLGSQIPILLFNSSGALAQTVDLQMGMTYQSLIVKYNSSGIFQWVIRAGSSDEVILPRIQLDTDNNLYVIGDYNANVTILDTDSTSTVITGGSNTDMFLARFDSAGEISWSAKMTGSDSEGIRSLEIFGDHMHVTGVYKSDPLVLTPGTGSSKNFVGGIGPSGPVGYGLTLALEKATGAYVWAVIFDAPADLTMVTCQSDDSGVVMIGTIPSEDVEIKDGEDDVIAEIVSGENAGSGVFVVKVNHDGEYLWHVKVEGVNSEVFMVESFIGYHSGNILDSAGNVYLKAHYYGTGEEAEVPKVYDKENNLIASISETSVTELQALSILLLQIKPNGTSGWITKIKPEIGSEMIGIEMVVGADDNLYFTANSEKSDIRLYNSGSNSPVKTITTNTTDFFNPCVISYSSTGKYRWLFHIQYPEFEMGPLTTLIKQADTRLKKMNILINFFNSRLGLTPERRVYLNLVAFPGLNEFFVENKKVLTLEFDSSHPYLLALDGSTSSTDGDNTMILIAIIIAILVIVGLLMYMRR